MQQYYITKIMYIPLAIFDKRIKRIQRKKIVKKHYRHSLILHYLLKMNQIIDNTIKFNFHISHTMLISEQFFYLFLFI